MVFSLEEVKAALLDIKTDLGEVKTSIRGILSSMYMFWSFRELGPLATGLGHSRTAWIIHVSRSL